MIRERIVCGIGMVIFWAAGGCMDQVQARAGADQAVDPGMVVTLDGSSSTPSDPARLAHSWEQIEGPQVTLGDASAAATTFGAPRSSTESRLVFKLTVTYVDFSGKPYPPNSGSDEVLVRVRADRNADDEGDAADGEAADDPEGNANAADPTDGQADNSNDNGSNDNQDTENPEGVLSRSG